MTMTIARYDLPFTHNALVEMPEGSRIFQLTYQVIPGPVLTEPEACIIASVWAVVDSCSETVKRRFFVVREGDAIDNPWAAIVGTVVLAVGSGYPHKVLHVFDGGYVRP